MRRALWLTVISFHGLFFCLPFVFAGPQHASAGRSAAATTVISDGAQAIAVEQKPAVDLAVRAAGIEVAWLHHAATYPYRLRAEPAPNQEGITLTGFVPNNQLREKALSIAVRTALEIPLFDHITVQSNMALPALLETNKNQASIVKDQLDKAVPGLATRIQVLVDDNGVTTVTGRVDDLGDRRKIIHALQGIPGCTAVRYGLYIGGPLASPLVTQSAIKESQSAAPDHGATKTPMNKTAWKQMPDRNRLAVTAQRESQPSIENSDLTKPSATATPVKPEALARLALADASGFQTKSSMAITTQSSEGKISQAHFTISSVSGLTPPSPPIMLGMPIISLPAQPSMLADVPAIPLSPAKLNSTLPGNEEITKSVVNVASQKPAKSESLLPIIQLQPTTSNPGENIEQIGVKPH